MFLSATFIKLLEQRDKAFEHFQIEIQYFVGGSRKYRMHDDLPGSQHGGEFDRASDFWKIPVVFVVVFEKRRKRSMRLIKAGAALLGDAAKRTRVGFVAALVDRMVFLPDCLEHRKIKRVKADLPQLFDGFSFAKCPRKVTVWVDTLISVAFLSNEIIKTGSSDYTATGYCVNMMWEHLFIFTGIYRLR